MPAYEARFVPAASSAASGAPRPMLRLAPTMLAAASVNELVAPTQSLPVANTQVGNVFKDRLVAGMAWYLPSFQLADDVDPAFAFTATQSGVDSSGNPFNRATLTFGIRKMSTADVTAYRQQNPSVLLREIPLNGLQATLTTTAQDPQTGALSAHTYSGILATAADGSLTLTFNTLLGPGAIVAYEDLQNGGASLELSASYDVWRAVPAPQPGPTMWGPAAFERPPAMVARPGGGMIARPMFTRPMPIVARPSGEPAPNNYVQGTAAFTATLQLSTKYAGVGYATKYTVTDGAVTRVIASVNDLMSFNRRQSEFSEFTALGDISQRYPSFDRLYVGVLSRTIVVLPAQYGILRGADGTAAVCRALLDPSGTSGGACKFQFAFLLGPVISQVDLLALSKEIAENPASHDCKVALPTRLDAVQASTPLATPFMTTATYAPGDQPYTFSLTVEVLGDAEASSAAAVANANLFIGQLTTSMEPYLAGRVRVKLDDSYEHVVETGVTLNFHVTSAGNEIGFAVDPSGASLVLTNTSPLDLTLSRYAIVANDQVSVQSIPPGQQKLLAGQNVSFPTNGISGIAQLPVDRTLTLESPLTKTATSRYLALEAKDVQDVQYQLTVSASGVDFAKLGIARIDVHITLIDLPNITVPAFSLRASDTQGSLSVSLPILYAVTSLVATVALTIQPSDQQQPSAQRTFRHDFVDDPVLIVDSKDLAGESSPAG